MAERIFEGGLLLVAVVIVGTRLLVWKWKREMDREQSNADCESCGDDSEY